MNRNFFYRMLYARWARAPAQRQPGYTVLLPVPGDIPVFLKIAMSVIARQDPASRRETLVLPDYPGAAFEDAFQRYRASWPDEQPIRIVRMDALSRLLARRMRNPHLNYWLQFVHGVQAARCRYALLHDADLFIRHDRFLLEHYQAAAASGAACRGVSPVWDAWYRRKGYAHVVATWELLFDVEWARSFQPWEHRGFAGQLDGEQHSFDVTLFPQCRTDPSRILLHGQDGLHDGGGDVAAKEEPGFIHFNYVISTYRWFQKSFRSDRSYEDEYFRILLVRLLIDALDDSDWRYEAPSIGELQRGLSDSRAPVTYRGPDTAPHYPEFRRRMDQLLVILTPQQAEKICEGLRPFDTALGWPGRAFAAADGAAA